MSQLIPSQFGSIVGAYEAKTHFSELLGRVEAGEEVTITRHGTAVAKLIPVRRESTPEERAAAIEAMQKAARGRSLGGLKVKELIAEGRR
jgi:prevent-host-death family protein